MAINILCETENSKPNSFSVLNHLGVKTPTVLKNILSLLNIVHIVNKTSDIYWLRLRSLFIVMNNLCANVITVYFS